MIAAARKALMAAAFTLAGTLGGAMVDGDLTTGEAVAAVGVALVAGAGTWLVPNAAAPPTSRRPGGRRG